MICFLLLLLLHLPTVAAPVVFAATSCWCICNEPVCNQQAADAWNARRAAHGMPSWDHRCHAAGIVEPVRGGMEAGLRLGVGKAEQESFFISADNVTRKRLETEVQADEDYERTIKREVCCLNSHLQVHVKVLNRQQAFAGGALLHVCSGVWRVCFSSTGAAVCLIDKLPRGSCCGHHECVRMGTVTVGCDVKSGTHTTPPLPLVKQSITGPAWCAPAA